MLTGFTDALGNKWAYDYDGAARPATRTDPSGSILKSAYTSGNRIAGLTAGDAQVSFDYSGILRDSLGRLTGYTDSSGNQLAYKYDGAGQLTGLTLPGGKTGPGSTTTCIASARSPTGRATPRSTATTLPAFP